MAKDRREDAGQFYRGGSVIPRGPVSSGGGGTTDINIEGVVRVADDHFATINRPDGTKPFESFGFRVKDEDVTRTTTEVRNGRLSTTYFKGNKSEERDTSITPGQVGLSYAGDVTNYGVDSISGYDGNDEFELRLPKRNGNLATEDQIGVFKDDHGNEVRLLIWLNDAKTLGLCAFVAPSVYDKLKRPLCQLGVWQFVNGVPKSYSSCVSFDGVHGNAATEEYVNARTSLDIKRTNDANSKTVNEVLSEKVSVSAISGEDGVYSISDETGGKK